MIIVTRKDWGAAGGRGRIIPIPVPWVVVHHTTNPAFACGAALSDECAIVRGIERHHVIEEEWAGIGYQWLIAVPSGHVFEGRGWGSEGAHCPGHNRDSVAIAFIADGRSDDLSPAAIESARSLIALGIAEGHIARDFELIGHRDARATECPGDRIYSRLQELRP